MTHVLAIGGAGNMGRPAVRTLLSEPPGLDELTVADSDGDRAREFVAALVSDRVNARTPDITDGSAVTAALQGVSLVVITVGPTVLEACIEAGVDYVDICDDWEPTEAMLALDDRAQGAGVTAVVGFGASPGISNLLAVYAEDQLETADEVATAWFTGPGAGGSDAPAAAVQGVHMVAD